MPHLYSELIVPIGALFSERMPAFRTVSEIFRRRISALRTAVQRIFRMPETEVININGRYIAPFNSTSG